MARFSGVDVTAAVSDLQGTLGLRAANIYNVGAKAYIFKLHRTDDTRHLLIEAGVRVHVTKFSREKPAVPSPFTVKLRRFLRTKRITSVKQMGMDRAIDFTFGSSPADYHLIVEFYSKGNIILTDPDYNILAVFRNFIDPAKGINVSPGKLYDISTAKPFEPTTKEILRKLLTQEEKPKEENKEEGKEAVQVEEKSDAKPQSTVSAGGQKVKLNKTQLRKERQRQQRIQEKQQQIQKAQQKNVKRKEKDPRKTQVRSLLNNSMNFGPAAIDHILLDAGIPQNTNLGAFDFENQLEALYQSFRRFEETHYVKNEGFSGYLLYKPGAEKVKVDAARRPKKSAEEVENEDQEREQAPKEEEPLYCGYSPLPFLQHEKTLLRTQVESFSEAVDRFFSQMEAKRGESALESKEKQAFKRMDQIRRDQEQRLAGLEQEERTNVLKAELIEANLDDVSQVIEIIRSALANSLDWSQLETLVKEEQRNGNPIASIIHRLKLDTNRVTLMLSKTPEFNEDDPFDEDGGEGEQSSMLVDIDVSLTAYANACHYYDQKRSTEEKKEKTLQAVDIAVKAAEKKAFSNMKKVKGTETVRKMRKRMWFEKFLWFISSDGLVVVGGRDAQQNEMLVKKYLRKGDAYVHADIHGAPSVIVKNKSDAPLPPSTLLQAGTFSMCFSSAWNAKVVTSAWWVYPHQVSKTAPTGEYLTTGSFMIRGKKNFLPPASLIMSFGFLFRLEESSPSLTLAKQKEEERKGKKKEEEEKEEENEEENEEEKEGEKEGDEEWHVVGGEEEKEKMTIDKRPAHVRRMIEKREQEAKEKEAREKEEKEKERKANEDEDEDEDEEILDEEEEGEDEDVIPKVVESDEEKEGEEEEEEETSLFSWAQTKYALDDAAGLEEEEEKDDEEENKTEQEGTQRRARLSAKQRKLIKAGKLTLEEAMAGGGAGGNSPAPQKQAPKKKEEKAPAPAAAPRGKKGKLKKIKNKYGDQDEEEREASLQVLGGGNAKGAQGGKGGKGGAKGRGGAQGNAAGKGRGRGAGGAGGAGGAAGGAVEKEVKEVTEKEAQEAEEKAKYADIDREEVRKARQERKEEKKKEKEEVQALLEKEKLLDQSILESMTEIDKLCAHPKSDDILLYAIPVCGPHAALQSFKYKVKLTPGNMKRGRMAHASVNMMMANPDGTAREKDLIKFTPDNDLFANLISNAKISAPGMKKFTANQKSNKKAAAAAKKK